MDGFGSIGEGMRSIGRSISHVSSDVKNYVVSKFVKSADDRMNSQPLPQVKGEGEVSNRDDVTSKVFGRDVAAPVIKKAPLATLKDRVLKMKMGNLNLADLHVNKDQLAKEIEGLKTKETEAYTNIEKSLVAFTKLPTNTSTKDVDKHYKILSGYRKDLKDTLEKLESTEIKLREVNERIASKETKFGAKDLGGLEPYDENLETQDKASESAIDNMGGGYEVLDSRLKPNMETVSYFDPGMSEADRIRSDLNDANGMKQKLVQELNYASQPRKGEILKELGIVEKEIKKLEVRAEVERLSPTSFESAKPEMERLREIPKPFSAIPQKTEIQDPQIAQLKEENKILKEKGESLRELSKEYRSNTESDKQMLTSLAKSYVETKAQYLKNELEIGRSELNSVMKNLEQVRKSGGDDRELVKQGENIRTKMNSNISEIKKLYVQPEKEKRLQSEGREESVAGMQDDVGMAMEQKEATRSGREDSGTDVEMRRLEEENVTLKSQLETLGDDIELEYDVRMKINNNTDEIARLKAELKPRESEPDNILENNTNLKKTDAEYRPPIKALTPKASSEVNPRRGRAAATNASVKDMSAVEKSDLKKEPDLEKEEPDLEKEYELLMAQYNKSEPEKENTTSKRQLEVEDRPLRVPPDARTRERRANAMFHVDQSKVSEPAKAPVKNASVSAEVARSPLNVLDELRATVAQIKELNSEIDDLNKDSEITFGRTPLSEVEKSLAEAKEKLDQLKALPGYREVDARIKNLDRQIEITRDEMIIQKKLIESEKNDSKKIELQAELPKIRSKLAGFEQERNKLSL